MLQDEATERPAPPWPQGPSEPTGPAERTHRLSWTRVIGLALFLTLLASGGYVIAHRAVNPGPPLVESWGVPYVDVTLTPTYQFQDPSANPSRNIALAFVVASPADPCAPSWGAAYSMDEAATSLELDRRIAQLRAIGGDVMVSFGGQANTELAVSCTDAGRLTQAYESVIDRYGSNVIDLDIEGEALDDLDSVRRRAEVLADLQDKRRAAGEDLAVWLTLPVATYGLLDNAQQVVLETIKAGVNLRGVNVMTMDYGTFTEPPDMLEASTDALEATAGQLAGLYAQAGIVLDDTQRWARLGATPMIGQNDVDNEVFTLDDARGLADFADERGLGRMSLWSINRDAPCGQTFSDVAVHSATCSGIEQQPLEFSQLYAQLPGRASDASTTDAIVLPSRQSAADDPNTSPYPIWRPTAQYPLNYKVVWHQMVYQAKWFNQGVDPSVSPGNGTPSPWALLGPVEPTDGPPQPIPTVTGVTDIWDPMTLYSKGDQVLFDGLPYVARWLTSGDTPETEFPVGNQSPWKPLFVLPGEPPTT
jgi:chitinase